MIKYPENNSIHNFFSQKGCNVEVDCPRCQAPIEINDLEKVAYCQACGASLEVEMGGAGFALVSSVEDDEETTSVSPENQEPDSLNDPVLSDHTRWRVGSVFVALFGLVVLGCAVYSGIQEYTEKGMWGADPGKRGDIPVGNSLCQCVSDAGSRGCLCHIPVRNKKVPGNPGKQKMRKYS